MLNINISKTTWNLTPLLKSDNDPNAEKELKKVRRESYRFINKWKNREDYLKSPRVLKQALDEYENWSRNYGTSGGVGYYFWLRSSQEQDNPKIKAKNNKINDASLKIGNDIDFFTHRIAKIPAKEQHKFLKSALLKRYRHFLKGLFENAKYLLSEDEEKILNLKSVTSYSNWVDMVSEFLSKEQAEVFDENGKKAIKSFYEILALTNNKNKKIRDKAAKEFSRISEKHSDAAEHEMNSILQHKKVNDELRKIKRPDLSRHISDDIDSKVVDTLMNTVSKRYITAKNYYKLKAKLFGLKKLAYHERNLEYGKINKKFSYKDSVELVYRTLNNLDSSFGDIFKDFVENGNIDVYPKKGKAGGAFCMYNLHSLPIYVLLNHSNKLDDVRTLAHEMGHAINDTLTKEHQHALYAYTSKATTEVASTFMEDFVLREILKEADDEMRLALMVTKLNSDVSTIYRQVAAYKFEQELHEQYREKGYLPNTEIGKLFQKHMRSYMGKYVEQSKGSENWWVYWGHFRAYFYNYSYASGLLISKSLQSEVRKDATNINKVKKFLAAGSSESPKKIFSKLGIDITSEKFWDKGLSEVALLLDETEKLAKKLKKI